MNMRNLRDRAEQLLKEPQPEITRLSPEEDLKQAHELSVHQVELEMQNEELRQAQLRLAESQREYYDLFDRAPVGFMVMDRQGRIQKINHEASRLLHSSEERLVGKFFFTYVHDFCRDRYNEHQQRVLKTGGPETCEVRLRDLQGGAIPVRIESVLQQTEETPPAIRSALVDQTESHRAWEALETANRHLKQQAGQMRKIAEELTYAEQRERQRLAKLLHDHLQQLLVASKFNLELVRTQIRAANLPSKLNPAAELCDKTDQLLAQSLVTSRSLAVELSPPVLQEGSLEAALHWLARRMREMHGLTVDFITSGPAIALPDNIRLSLFEITRELLLNVVKHSGADAAQVTLTRTEGKIRIVVADLGRGFDLSQLEAENGAGSYGMLTARHRISWMQGDLNIQSAPGLGCRVEISVPVAWEIQAPSPSTGTVEKPPLAEPERLRDDPRIRVLVADDHHVLRDGLTHIILLEPGMLVVGEAANGREAVELARQVHPDVIIMDINMPEMNGIEATRQITSENPHVHVIGLSMHGQTDMIHAICQAGADSYLSKGCSSHELISAIRQTVQKNPAPA